MLVERKTTLILLNRFFDHFKSTALQQSKILTTENQFKPIKAISAFIMNLVTRR